MMFDNLRDLISLIPFLPATIIPVIVSIKTTTMTEVIAHVIGKKNAINDALKYEHNFVKSEFILVRKICEPVYLAKQYC